MSCFMSVRRSNFPAFKCVFPTIVFLPMWFLAFFGMMGCSIEIKCVVVICSSLPPLSFPPSRKGRGGHLSCFWSVVPQARISLRLVPDERLFSEIVFVVFRHEGVEY